MLNKAPHCRIDDTDVRRGTDRDSRWRKPGRKIGVHKMVILRMFGRLRVGWFLLFPSGHNDKTTVKPLVR